MIWLNLRIEALFCVKGAAMWSREMRSRLRWWSGQSLYFFAEKEHRLRTLGHSNIGITMNLYVHTTEEQKQKEIDQIADVLKVV